MVTLPELTVVGLLVQLVIPADPVTVHVVAPVGATPPEPVTVAVNVRFDPTEPLPLPVRTIFPNGEILPTVTDTGEVVGSAA